MFKSIISCVHNIYIKYIFVNQKGALQVKTHFYDLKFNDAQGEEQSMESYKGKVILIINTPVETENNEQLTDADHIYQKYKDQGLAVLGFPSDDFNRKLSIQNPLADNDDKVPYTPTFPLMEEVHVRGHDIHPVFQYLTEGRSALFINKVKWNYTKFIVSREGRVVSRYAPQKSVMQLEDEIQELLIG